MYLFPCRGGHLHVVQYIVQQDASTTESKNPLGRTPLHYACMYVPPPIVLCITTQQERYFSIVPWQQCTITFTVLIPKLPRLPTAFIPQAEMQVSINAHVT